MGGTRIWQQYTDGIRIPKVWEMLLQIKCSWTTARKKSVGSTEAARAPGHLL